ncbi:MAG TPA: cytochrome P450 [Chloroflexia bacterium]|nr:cytochrome P450 [Chloroflexia bacterium]
MRSISNQLDMQKISGPSGGCPVDHSKSGQRKTARTAEPQKPPINQDNSGVWHVMGFEEARAILRSGDTKQAGFRAEMIEQIPRMMNLPILYLEGKPHQSQRRQTARFFTPKTVSSNYQKLMEQQAEALIETLKREKQADLSKLSLVMAVRVAGKVVGLTDSLIPGMAKRLEAFFEQGTGDMTLSWRPDVIFRLLKNQWRVGAFYLFDVWPAIRKRRKQPQEDVITHLIEQHYKNTEILTECVTYGAAGMVTTREFISVATWHLLEQPALRERYLKGSDAERHAILEEILRLEPVVGHLFRRAKADLHLESEGQHIIIPQNALIDLHIYAENADEKVVGDTGLELCPGRKLQGEKIPAELMSFGDGHHRCPGSYVAIQETDIFLRRLLALENLRVVAGPDLSWNDLTMGYEIRDFIIAVD